jgi:hypothetical protein
VTDPARNARPMADVFVSNVTLAPDLLDSSHQVAAGKCGLWGALGKGAANLMRLSEKDQDGSYRLLEGVLGPERHFLHPCQRASSRCRCSISRR